MIWVTMVLMLLVQDVPSSFPQVTISNGRVRAVVLLPDASAGYYRGTRFDWSGAIASLRANGHEYFGPWFSTHDPRGHDGITGPVEEFQAGDSSVGYAEAPAGGTFVRIGVGHVRKPDEAAYRRFGTYDLVDGGTWTVDTGPDRVTFTHVLGDAAGYAYEYRKTLHLEDDALVIDHVLRNTGRKRIDTLVYDHNFFTLDRKPTGAPVIVRFPFDPTPLQPVEPLGALAGRQLRFQRDLGTGEHVFTEFVGYGATSADYDFRLEHQETGAGVRIRADRPVKKLIFWSASHTVCPEPYVDASVAPGETTTWQIRYDFYER